MKNQRFRTIVILSLIIFTVLIVRIIFGFIQISDSNNATLPLTYSITTEDSNLITKKYWQDAKILEVHNSKTKNPISVIELNEKYHLLIYQEDLAANISLPNLISVSFKNENTSTGYVYDAIYRYTYEFSSRDKLPKKTSHMFLTLSGDSIQNIINSDSIICYHLQCNNLSIKFSQESLVDILLTGKTISSFGKHNPFSTELLFLKRNEKIYLMMLNSLDQSPVPSNLLYSIVTGS